MESQNGCNPHPAHQECGANCSKNIEASWSISVWFSLSESQRFVPRLAAPRPCRLPLARPIASDNALLCKLPALKSLDFFDTLQTPPKTPGNRALQALQLAACCYPRVCGGTTRKIGQGSQPGS